MRLRAFIVVGLLVAGGLALFGSPWASGSPDGLERVAVDQGFADEAEPHALRDLPTAGYGEDGLGSGVAGLLGVGVTFLVAGGLALGLKRWRRPAEAT